MSKLSQLQQFEKWQLPTPRFRELGYQDYQAGKTGADSLRFPLAVRSCFQGEDGDARSFAGHFQTELFVTQDQLPDAIGKVFGSYPQPEGQLVILQEMVVPEFSGVLFAFRDGVWKLELTDGHPEDLVSGRRDPLTILLPRFSRTDIWFSAFWKFWKAYNNAPVHLDRALILLSSYAGVLLRRMEPDYGLDIEFAVAEGRLYLLQARPITTPEEKEQVLTTANHKEILPPFPSRMMTAIISGSGNRLFEYYRDLDPSLPPSAFVEEAAGMPWINLSSLLDMTVHWGLPTSLVVESIGAADFYQVGFRPWRAICKIPVFFRALGRQRRAAAKVRNWIKTTRRSMNGRMQERELLWQEKPAAAFRQWLDHFQEIYVDLVTYMQILTSAMAGPVKLLDRLGLLAGISGSLTQKSTSTNYLSAFNDLRSGRIDQETFLRQFGHRGFYESDLGQPRFGDYSAGELSQLLQHPEEGAPAPEVPPVSQSRVSVNIWSRLFAGVIRSIHAREYLRHEAMYFFWQFRKELERHSRSFLEDPFSCWQFRPEELMGILKGEKTVARLRTALATPRSGWDMDTFLHNRAGRRLSVEQVIHAGKPTPEDSGIGICPGIVRGQVWRVAAADLSQLARPPFDRVILVADALDPGWIPFFSQVDGVISYTGGLLSHASIILREVGLPAITQLPSHISLQTGDRIEMDGRTGKVTVVNRQRG